MWSLNALFDKQIYKKMAKIKLKCDRTHVPYSEESISINILEINSGLKEVYW